MRFSIITHFEPIPTEANARLMRAGLLAQRLAARGHSVTWWTPNFDHYLKRKRTPGDAVIDAGEGLEIRLLKSIGYKRHIGVRRLINNELLARRWSKQVRSQPVPDLVLSGWPTPEFGSSAVRYCKEMNIPAVIDIRDLWPDLWLGVLPNGLQGIGKVALKRYYRMKQETMKGVSSIVGITDDFVDWGVASSRKSRTNLDRSFAFRFRPSDLTEENRANALRLLEDHGYRPDDRIQCVFAGSFSRSFDLFSFDLITVLIKDKLILNLSPV